jgi:hypothetical protein
MSKVNSSSKKLNKAEAIQLVNDKLSIVINHSNTIFSSINKTLDVWWFEPENSRFNSDFHLLLCDHNSNTLYYFFIPKGSVTNPKDTFYQRKDFKDKSHIEIWVDNTDFKDRKKTEIPFSFSKYLKEKISY